MVHYDGSYKNDTLDIQSISTILSWMCLEVGQGLWKTKYKRCAMQHAEVSSVKFVENWKDV